MSKLTAKERRFIDEYLIDLNATQAAARAGYSKRTAEQQGYQLLRRPRVAEAITAQQRKIATKLEVTQERVVAELAKIGFSDIRKAVTWRTCEREIANEEDLEPQGHGGSLKRSRAMSVNLVELLSSDDLDDDTAAAISEISQTDKGGLKVKFHDKRAALVDLAKYLGMFKDEVKLVGDITVEVVKFADGK